MSLRFEAATGKDLPQLVELLGQLFEQEAEFSPDAAKQEAALKLILADPKVEAILVNIFGGITRGDEVAHGLIEARAQQVREVPMIVRIVGTNAAEAADLLRAARFETATSLDEAASKAVAAGRAASAA